MDEELYTLDEIEKAYERLIKWILPTIEWNQLKEELIFIHAERQNPLDPKEADE